MASPPPDRHWRNSSPSRCYRHACLSSESIPGRTYEEGNEADWECRGSVYEDQEEQRDLEGLEEDHGSMSSCLG